MSGKISAASAALLGLVAAQACAAAAPPSGEEETGGSASIAGRSSSSSATGSGNAESGGTPGVAGAPGVGGSAELGGGSNGGGSTAALGNAGSTAGGNNGSAGAAALSQFGQVTSLLNKRCAGSKCHSESGMQLPFASATGSALYSELTTPVPANTPHCVGITLVTPNDTGSPLLKIVASGGKIACTKPKTENVGPMPDKCTTTSNTATGMCLTAAEIQVISSWISAGAPQN